MVLVTAEEVAAGKNVREKIYTGVYGVAGPGKLRTALDPVRMSVVWSF